MTVLWQQKTKNLFTRMTVPWQHLLLLSRARPVMRPNMRYSILSSRDVWLFRLSSVRWGILIYLLSWQYEVFNWLSLKCDESFASLNNEQWKQGDLWGTLESAHTPQGLSKVIILDVNIPEIFTFTFFNFSFPTNFSGMSGKHSSPTWSAPAIALTTISGSE